MTQDYKALLSARGFRELEDIIRRHAQKQPLQDLREDPAVQRAVRETLFQERDKAALVARLTEKYQTAPSVVIPATEDRDSARRLLVGVRVVHAELSDVRSEEEATRRHLAAHEAARAEVARVLGKQYGRGTLEDDIQINTALNLLYAEARQERNNMPPSPPKRGRIID